MKAIYRVRKVYKYSEIVEVEAESSKEAKDLAMHTKGEREYDDSLWDCEIIDYKEVKE